MARSKRDASRRVGWNKLSAAMRKRYIGAGVSRQAWESGTDLRAARGHTPARPEGSAPLAPVLDFIAGKGTDTDARKLATWRRDFAPPWLPDRAWMADDTAGALSMLKAPNTWAAVDFTPRVDEPWTMTVTYRRGYAAEILIPVGSHKEILQMLTDIQRGGRAAAKALGVRHPSKWGHYIDDEIDFHVFGTT